MAQIPLGEFGQARAIPSADSRRLDFSGLSRAGQGAAAIAEGLRDVAGAVANHAAEQQRQDEALARAKSANALLDDQQQISAKTAEIQQRIADSSLPYTKAQEEFQTWLSTRQAPAIEGLAPDDAERFQGGLKRNRFGATAALDGVVETAKRADFKGQIIGMRDRLGKIASDPNADLGKIVEQGAALRELADQSGLGATFDKDQQEFVDRVYYDNAVARLNTARGSLDGLAALEKDLIGEGGRYAGKLDANRQNAVLGQITTYRGQLEAKQERALDRAEAHAQKALETVDRYTAEGIMPPPDALLELQQQVAGTSYADQWNTRMEGLHEAMAVAKLPPDQQLRYVEQQEAKLGQTMTLDQKQNLVRLRNVAEARVKELRTDPLGYDAKVQGATVDPLDLQALVSGDMNQAGQQIAQRMVAVAAVQRRYGASAGTSPLRPDEARVLSEAIAQQTPRKVAEMYGSLRRAFNDDRAYLAVMGQIAPDSPVRAHAGVIAMTNARAADLILRGEALLNPSKGDKATDGKGAPFPMPSPDKFEQAFAEEVGDAFAGKGQAYQQALQVVRAGYAGAASADGDIGGDLDDDDTSAKTGRTRLQDVIHFAIGTPVKRGAQTVFAPLGMDEDRFNDNLEAAWRAAPRPAGVDDLDRFHLLQYGGNSYRVVRGGEFLYGTDGKPLTLTMGR